MRLAQVHGFAITQQQVADTVIQHPYGSYWRLKGLNLGINYNTQNCDTCYLSADLSLLWMGLEVMPEILLILPS